MRRRFVFKSIQQVVGHLSTTNYSGVKKAFLQSVLLSFGQSKYTKIGFWIILNRKTRVFAVSGN